jgi:hypothetical protein
VIHWLAALAIGLAAARSPAPVRPVWQRELPPAAGQAITSLAWPDDETLLLGGMDGVRRYALADGRVQPFIAGQPVPDGITAVGSVESDGKSVIVSSYDGSQYACSFPDCHRLFYRRRSDFTLSNFAVSGRTLFLLGFRTFELESQNAAIVWKTPLSYDWSDSTPLHRLQSAAAGERFYRTLMQEAGAITLEPDGGVDVISSAEAGVFRFDHEGRLRERLGGEMNELVLTRADEIFRDYRADEEGRYRNVLNRQPTIDDLVMTPDGVAIVVRLVSGDVVHWELWFPGAKGVRKVVALAVTHPAPFGHLRCDTRGRRMACITDRPLDRSARLGTPQLLLFELPQRKVIATTRAGHVEELPSTRAALAGETIWTWSDDEVPHRISDQVPQTRVVNVAAPAPGGRVRWGTAAMLTAIPDRLLPEVRLDADGHATIHAPAGEIVFARVADETTAGWWQRLDALTTRLETFPTVPLTTAFREDDGVASAAVVVHAARGDARPLYFDTPSILLPDSGEVTLRAWSALSSAVAAPITTHALPHEIRLPLAGEAVGRVRRAKGEPLAGVSVTFASRAAGGYLLREARTDRAGRFLVAGVPAGTAEVDLLADGIAATRSANIDGAPLPDFVLAPSRALRVSVRDAQGAPVAGALVRAEGARGDHTGANGQALLTVATDVPSGEVHAAGYSDAVFAIEEEGDAVVTLRRGTGFRLRLVRGDDGSPVNGGTFVLHAIDGTRTSNFEGDVIERGGLRPGPLRLEVRAAGLAPLRLPERALSAGETVDYGTVALPSPLPIVGTAVDSADGRAVAAHIRAVRTDEGDPPALALLTENWISADADARGDFRVAAGSGSWRLLISADGYAPAVADNLEIRDQPLQLGNVRLQRARTLLVRCRGQACGEHAELVPLSAATAMGEVSAAFVDGVARLTPVAPGAALLRLHSERGIVYRRNVVVADDRDVTEEEVQPVSVRVSGRVTREGRAASDGRVIFRMNGGGLITIHEVTPSGTTFLRNIGAFAAEHVGAVTDGGYVVDGLPPGEYSILYSGREGNAPPRVVTIPEQPSVIINVEAP